jgi:hypothetical protein
MSMMQAMNGFIEHFNTTDGGALGYFSNISSPYFVGQTSVFVIQTLIGDAILV